ncbi:glycosyltransferase [Roseiflexus sp.]|uniref:glycosyltransferase n=1 Tax=Roseiflexus sp. TaxID=2562120 RepID=UPI0021DE9DD7|nr:glycosyltransferase [Roseiflexus sp.]GIW00058.1 MAG: cellulose synthase [Roseiflexus sp.]
MSHVVHMLWLDDPDVRAELRLRLLRVLVATNLLLGFLYLSWRYTATINWSAWPIALGLVVAETYSYIDAWLFGLTLWRLKQRGEPPPPPSQATVDVFITCYNEPVEIVRETAIAARDIRYPHRTYLLDDGNSSAMRAMAQEIGIGYLVRSEEWKGKQRHAKAGNLNNALCQTNGEFVLVLDADQIPSPDILDRTLGYFADERVALVQTPQWFYNVPPDDPLGSQAPLFYGPIMQGKDGWNAAFFCGSNAILRREALMQIGIANYVRDLELRVQRALRTAETLLRRAVRQAQAVNNGAALAAINDLQAAVRASRRMLREGRPIQEVTWYFQQRAAAAARPLVAEDLARLRAEVATIPGLNEDEDLTTNLSRSLDDETILHELTIRERSPLAAIATVRELLLAVDVDRSDEAQPVMPLATISVTEDMATAMRLHAAGWRSVYHDEILARGLAPEDLRSALQQRLRWAQGTIQVMLRENPLFIRRLGWGQRLMYFATMWSYLSGFFSVIYLAAPILYLIFGMLPVRAQAEEFFWRLVPYLITNELVFAVAGWKRATWRGRQYSLALFPLWIRAVISAIGNVYAGRPLGFVVTPKVRQGGMHLWGQLRLVRIQVITMALLILSAIWGLGRLALGVQTEGIPTLVNIFWIGYDLLMLSVVIDAALYQPEEQEQSMAADRGFGAGPIPTPTEGGMGG